MEPPKGQQASGRRCIGIARIRRTRTRTACNQKWSAIKYSTWKVDKYITNIIERDLHTHVTRGMNGKSFWHRKRKITSAHSMDSSVHYFTTKNKIIHFFGILRRLHIITATDRRAFFNNVNIHRRNRPRHNEHTRPRHYRSTNWPIKVTLRVDIKLYLPEFIFNLNVVNNIYFQYERPVLRDIHIYFI